MVCLLHVSKPRVHLQEDGCVYSYGTVRFACIGIISLVDRRVCWIILHVWKPGSSKHVEDIKKKKNVNLRNVNFFDLYPTLSNSSVCGGGGGLRLPNKYLSELRM